MHVSDEAVPAEQGPAYHRWIVDRRMTRVADWLRQHTNGGGVPIKQRYVEKDGSGRVSIQVRPLS